jgi:hypothetical protein
LCLPHSRGKEVGTSRIYKALSSLS